MTALVWGSGDRKYETGFSHGVFYPMSGPGVPWNGLISVVEGFTGADNDAYYLDGVNYFTFVGSKNFQATITAFSAPQEFSPCAGDKRLVPGFILTKQPRTPFNLAYQTGVGEDGYKIHLVYNAVASVNARGYSSESAKASPTIFSWKIDATPVYVPGWAPTAKFTVDSTKANPDILSALEDILYGTDDTDPYFPTITELHELFEV